MGRSPCCDKAWVKRGPWSQEEDATLRSFVERFGNAGNWITLPQKAGVKRCGKSCRLRWLNYLRPALRHGGFTEEEDNVILSLYGEIGSRWSVIASKLPGRTDNDVKNYWNTKLKKRYMADTTTTEPLPTGGDSVEVDRPLTPSLPFVNLDTVDDDGVLLHTSEQLYAEFMGLIVQQPATTGQSTRELSAASSSSSSTLGASPTASSAGSSSICPVDVDDRILLPESSSSSFFGFGDAYCTHAFGAAVMPDSFQELLGSSYDDLTVTQELLY